MPPFSERRQEMVLASVRNRWQTVCALPILVAVLLLALSACQPASSAEGERSPAIVAPSATPTEVEPPPVVTSIRATPTNLPSFSPLKRDEIEATSEANGTGDAGALEPDEQNATSTINEVAATTPGTTLESDATPDAAGTAEATPPPTFTPPPQSSDSPNEHYWLMRPVPAGGTTWTDKYYPYGSTRGGQLRTHHGVEFNVTYNTTIVAAGNGTVVVAGPDDEVAYGPQANFYGNVVVIEHDFQFAGQPLYTLYGHLNEVQVTVGEAVAAGQVIGLSGATGVADGPHMHFEVRVGSNDYGNTRNPLLWLAPFSDRGTVAGRVVWLDGEPVTGAPISLNRIDGFSPYYGTTTYAGTSVNGDDVWQENFVIDDVVAGYYQVTVRNGEDKVTVETWVRPQQTSFVEITLE